MKSTDRGPGNGRLKTISRTAAAVMVAGALTFGAGASALPANAVLASSVSAALQTEAQTVQNQQIIDVFNGINDYRKGKGLPALRIGLNASAVAGEWSARMSRSGTLDHSTTHTNDMRIASWSSAAENIAGAPSGSGRTLVDIWAKSAEDAAKMARAGDTVLGIGITTDKAGKMWATTTYYEYGAQPRQTYATAEGYLADIAVPAVPAAVPVIEGTPAFEQELKVQAASWPAGTSLSYQWWAGTQRLDGQTRANLTVPAEAAAQRISVEVTAKASGYRETSVFSAQTAKVPNILWVQNLVSPTIQGTVAGGQTLTANPGAWTDGTQLSFQWSTGGTGRTYVAEDSDTQVSVEVTGTARGMYPTTVTATSGVNAPPLTYSVKPFITGTATEGQVLTGNPGTWNADPFVSYNWMRNGILIAEAKNQGTYTPTAADVGATISFSADAALEGYIGSTVVSAATAAVKPMEAVKNIDKPSISGTAVEGGTLAAVKGTWTEGTALDYQWLREGSAISGADAQKYTPASGDVGKKISLKVTGTQRGYTPTTVTTGATPAVAKQAAATPAPTPSATPKPTATPTPTPTPSATPKPSATPTPTPSATPKPSAPAPAVEFKDVPAGAQFAREISWMSSEGISTGWTDKTYRPQNLVARDAMSAFMYRLADEPSYTAPGTSPFKDVAKSQSFYKEMSWLAKTGVSTGWTDGTYRPSSSVNRDAMAAFMYRLAGSPSFTAPKKSPFTDVSTTHPFYKEISWLAAQGISTGWDQPNGTKTYQPGTPVKRDAMAAFMYRFDQKGFKLTGAK